VVSAGTVDAVNVEKDRVATLDLDVNAPPRQEE
jgi:hypothetical protein